VVEGCLFGGREGEGQYAQDLSLDVHKLPSVTRALEAFTRMDRLEGDNGMFVGVRLHMCVCLRFSEYRRRMPAPASASVRVSDLALMVCVGV
jgi:hypothetical protein